MKMLRSGETYSEKPSAAVLSDLTTSQLVRVALLLDNVSKRLSDHATIFSLCRTRLLLRRSEVVIGATIVPAPLLLEVTAEGRLVC